VNLLYTTPNRYDHDSTSLQTNRQTDGRTDIRLAVAIPRFVLRGSHGENIGTKQGRHRGQPNGVQSDRGELNWTRIYQCSSVALYTPDARTLQRVR